MSRVRWWGGRGRTPAQVLGRPPGGLDALEPLPEAAWGISSSSRGRHTGDAAVVSVMRQRGDDRRSWGILAGRIDVVTAPGPANCR